MPRKLRAVLWNMKTEEDDMCMPWLTSTPWLMLIPWQVFLPLDSEQHGQCAESWRVPASFVNPVCTYPDFRCQQNGAVPRNNEAQWAMLHIRFDGTQKHCHWSPSKEGLAIYLAAPGVYHIKRMHSITLTSCLIGVNGMLLWWTKAMRICLAVGLAALARSAVLDERRLAAINLTSSDICERHRSTKPWDLRLPCKFSCCPSIRLNAHFHTWAPGNEASISINTLPKTIFKSSGCGSLTLWKQSPFSAFMFSLFLYQPIHLYMYILWSQ